MSEIARIVKTLVGDNQPGDVRVNGDFREKKHPADGMTAEVHLGDRAFSSIVNPLAYEDGGVEWCLRYGNAEAVRYTAASLIASYDYLLSSEITLKEATQRLRILRAARVVLWNSFDETKQDKR